MKLFKSKDFYSVALAVALSLVIVAVSVSAATTISTDISTGGTLAVTGASTLTGLATLTGGFISQASSTAGSTLTVGGKFMASSTALFTDAITAYSTLGVTGLATFGAGTFSSTLGVTGVTTLGYASSTAITTSGALIVGTTTPTTNAVAELSASGSATTTLYLGSSGASKGGCIQLEGPNDTVYRIYATTTGPLMVEAGACK